MTEPTVSADTTGSRAGSRFGHYLLRRLLGRGGFGEVYEAEDTVMHRVVALKLIAAAYSQNQVFRHRLEREAHTAGRLHEPHVVPIHGCGEIDGQLYIDMRLIDGTDLQTLLARTGPLSPPRAVAIVRQIGAALDAAHADTVIHRDVKPANILLTSDDFACLVDFGLANAANDAKLTSTGTTIGTFAYMSPERLGDGHVTHRADIYALACVLYECLTGSTPYPAGDLPALITAHLTAPIPRASQHRPQLPVGIDDVITRGMAKNPQDRYGSAGALAAAALDALTTRDQRQINTILASTQVAPVPERKQASTEVGNSIAPSPAAGAAPGTPHPPAETASTAAHAQQPWHSPQGPSNRPSAGGWLWRWLGRHKIIALAACAFIVVLGIVGNQSAPQPTDPQPTAPQTASPSSSPPRPTGPQPTTVQQLCARQAWPRPVPAVSGVILDDAGALDCWNNLKAIAPDGHDVMNDKAGSGTYRITDVSPAPGTLIGSNDWVTVHVVPINPAAGPPTISPCDWVTADKAAMFLGVSSVSTEAADDEAGAAQPFCTYSSGSQLVTSQLNLPASFTVDAQTELNMNMATGDWSEVGGLPGRAYCSTRQSDGKKSTTLLVLLSGNRLYQALGWNGQSCDMLKQFAQVATSSIGP